MAFCMSQVWNLTTSVLSKELNRTDLPTQEVDSTKALRGTWSEDISGKKRHSFCKTQIRL